MRSAGIFALAAGVMALEVALTRVLSFITYHHMTYLVIATAMLGLGAAGTYLTIVRARGRSAIAIERFAAASGLAAFFALFAVSRIEFRAMDMYHLGNPGNVWVVAALVILIAVPFSLAGVAIAAILSEAGAAVSRVYMADLTGSAAGALLAVALVNRSGAAAACGYAAALAAAAAVFMASRDRLAYAGLAAVLVVASPLLEHRSVLPLRVPPGKQLAGNEDGIELIRWHMITRLDVGGELPCRCSFGGALSSAYSGPEDSVRLIFQDGSNLTGMIHPHGTPERTESLGFFLQAAPFRLRSEANVLVLGSGGGVDVMVALYHHPQRVVAVDVNPQTMNLVRGRYGEFTGHILDRPDVEPVVAEARHFLEREHRKFDVIQLSGVDTWSATAAGAYALTENFIYTVEAFRQYLDHLEPDGLVGFSRPLGHPPAETLRIAATARAALEQLGAAGAYRHIAVVAGTGHSSSFPWAETLVKRSPFTAQEIQSLRRWAENRRFSLVFTPYDDQSAEVDTVLRVPPAQLSEFVNSHPQNITPVTDDRPFFFQFQRWRDLIHPPPDALPSLAMWVLIASFVVTLLLGALLILAPLRSLSRAHPQGARGKLGTFAFFASLGLGFILIEVTVLQRLSVFLGGPAYSMSFMLVGILLFAGLGSAVSGRFVASPARVLAVVGPTIAIATLLIDPIVSTLLPVTAPLSLAWRGAAAIACIAPIAFVLGMPFPTGLRLLDETEPSLKPWAWGVNACASVVGTTACMLLASAVGFRKTLWVAAATYLVGGLLLRLNPPARAATAPDARELTEVA